MQCQLLIYTLAGKIKVMAKSILLEGIDGSGKSTQVALLKKYLEEKGYEVLALREPGGTDYYQAIREHVHFTEFKRPPISDALTCAGGIAANIEASRQALAAGKWVATDRSYISNILYQTAQGLDFETAKQITLIGLGDFTYDYKILIDTPVDLGRKRLESIGKGNDYWESKGKNYFEKVNNLYHKHADEFGLVIIDGTKPIETLQQEIRTIIGV